MTRRRLLLGIAVRSPFTCIFTLFVIGCSRPVGSPSDNDDPNHSRRTPHGSASAGTAAGTQPQTGSQSSAPVNTQQLKELLDKTDSPTRWKKMFDEGWQSWTAQMGVRSPCPAIHEYVAMKHMVYHDLFRKQPQEVAAKLGPPKRVYQHKDAPKTSYWMTKDHWVTFDPTCFMVLPRNKNYDAMMEMFMKEECVERATDDASWLNP